MASGTTGHGRVSGLAARTIVLCVLTIVTSATGAEVVEEVSATTALETDIRQQPGYHWGDARFRPTVSVTSRFDDNVFTTSKDEKGDWVTLLSPRVKIDRSGEPLELQFNAGIEAGLYRRYTDEDFVDYWGTATAKLDVSDDIRLFGDIGFRFDHEGRDSLDSPRGASEPTTFWKGHADLGSRIRNGALTYQFGLTWETLDFDNVPSATGTIVNKDRNRTFLGAGLRVLRQLDGPNRVFLQGLVETRDYDRSIDQFGYRRSSDGYRMAIGLQHEHGKNKLEGYAGLLGQRYDDERFDDVQKVDFGGRMSLKISEDTDIDLKLQRSLNETTEVGSAGYVNTALITSADHAASARLSFSASVRYTISDYLNIGRKDRTMSATLAGKFFVTRNSYLLSGISHTRRDSNDAGLISGSDDFDRDTVFLNLVVLAYPLSH